MTAGFPFNTSLGVIEVQPSMTSEGSMDIASNFQAKRMEKTITSTILIIVRIVRNCQCLAVLVNLDVRGYNGSSHHS
jgi:hypothetical protein